MNVFRNRGISIVVDTLRQAEFDFASHQVPARTQEQIAQRLCAMPRSAQDRLIGDVRVREIDGWDVCFVIALDGADWVITIAGVSAAGSMESVFDYLMRAGKEALPLPVQRLLEGRKKG